MRGLVARCLFALGVLVFLTGTGLGPRAHAGFLALGGESTAGTTSLATDALPDGDAPQADFPGHPIWSPNGLWQSGGTTSSSGSPPPSGAASAAAANLSPPLVFDAGPFGFLREPAARFRLSKFLDSILDPPRAN